VAGAEPLLLRPPVTVVRLFLHSAGLASRNVNSAQWRAHLIARLLRQIDLSGDSRLLDMAEEIRDYPYPRDCASLEQVESGVVARPFRLATIDGVLSFFSTTTLLSTLSISQSRNWRSKPSFRPMPKQRRSCGGSPGGIAQNRRQSLNQPPNWSSFGWPVGLKSVLQDIGIGSNAAIGPDFDPM
jgi:hypothetical protein